MTNANKPRLVIIGNGMAGIRTLEELLAADPEQYQITVIGREPFGSYNRIMLSPVLARESKFADILIHDRSWYTQQGIQLLAGDEHEVRTIDRARSQLICQNGHSIHYDRLLIATGSDPIILDIPGLKKEGQRIAGVLGFRGIRDVHKMQELAVEGGEAIVIGAGLLGLEAAHGLNQLGMNVTVIHRSGYPLNRQLDQEAAQLLQQQLESRGIRFILNVNTKEITSTENEQGEPQIKSLTLDNGQRLPARLLIMATGISPNTTIAKQSGLHCNRGILVDDCLQTFDPKIYAVGECVEHRNITFGLVEPLFEQARVCANHLANHGMARYQYLQPATRLKVSGIQLFSMGEFVTTEQDVDDNHSVEELLIYRDPGSGIYKKLVIRNNRLVGAVLYGDTGDGPWYVELMRSRIDISKIRDLILFGQDLIDADALTLHQRDAA